MVTLTDPSGHVQHFSYDAHGRLLSWTADDGTQASYAYDNLGRRTSMTDATGTTHYAYDGNGNLLTVTEPDGAVFTAQYDQAGQRTSLTYPGGLQVTYCYNTKGQLVGLVDSRAGAAAYALDPDGRLITEELPGRLARRYHYEHGLLRRFTVWRDGVPVTRTELGYDPDARVISQRDDGQLREYRYDRLGQLIAARHPERERDAFYFTYDAVGNRVSMRHGDRRIHYRYDAASQLVAAEADGRRTEYQYDTSGRLTERVTGDEHLVIGYDGFGRPVTVATTRGPLVHRQASTFNGNGLTALLVLANTDDQREEERTASVRYRWSLDQIPDILAQQAEPVLDDALREHPDELTADFAYGYGRVFASHQHGAEAFHHDVFGSTVRTDHTAAWAQAAAYQVFGAPEPDHRPERQERRDRARDHELPAPELPRFGYLGELALGSVIDLRARNYDADLGRFTTRDPVDSQSAGAGNAGNPYAYAGNDPLDRFDPLGLLAVPPPGGYVQALRTAPAVPAPSGGQRANARSTIHLTAEDVASAQDINYTALHTLAVLTAQVAFSAQLLAPLSDFYREVFVPNAGKRGAINGSVDLAYVRGKSAAIWEIKKDTVYGSPENTNLRTELDEVDRYVIEWNRNPAAVGGTPAQVGFGQQALAPRFAGTIASHGPGLATHVPIPASGTLPGSRGKQMYDYALNPTIPQGVVLYGPLDGRRPQPQRPGITNNWWWLFFLVAALSREGSKRTPQPKPVPPAGVPPRPKAPVPLLAPLTPGTAASNGAYWPFLLSGYPSVYGLEPPRA